MSGPAVILYDGDCNLCRASVRWLQRVDRRRRLRFENIREPGVSQSHPEVDPQRAIRRMHLITPGDRRVLAGFRAFRWVAGRVPVLWPLWPLLHLPGATSLGERVYDHVARNRFAFARCAGEAGHGERDPRA